MAAVKSVANDRPHAGETFPTGKSGKFEARWTAPHVGANVANFMVTGAERPEGADRHSRGTRAPR